MLINGSFSQQSVCPFFNPVQPCTGGQQQHIAYPMHHHPTHTNLQNDTVHMQLPAHEELIDSITLFFVKVQKQGRKNALKQNQNENKIRLLSCPKVNTAQNTSNTIF